MTDKTDIAALTNERLLEIKSILSGFEDGYDTVDDRENYEAMRGAQLLIDELISLRDQLEEERQQREAAEAELAAVRGQKGQIAFRYRWVADEEHEASRWMYEDRPEEFDSIMKLEGAEWEEFRITPASKLTIKEAVSAYISKSAGIVVKDGERDEITCWSCKKSMTLAQHSSNDGLCPHCNVEIDLEE